MRQKELMGTSKYSFAAILHCLLPHLFGSNAQQNPILLALFAFKLRQNPTQSCVPLVFRGALIKKLSKLGVVFLRHGKEHDIYYQPSTKKEAAVPRHNEINEYVAKRILKEMSE